MSTQVSIIIPVYNRFDLTRDCLASLKEHAPADLADFNYQVIVVDNASTDATATELQPLGESLFPGRFKALRQAANLNFAGGCNSGAELAKGQRLLFLNNDLLFAPGWFTPLWRAMEEDASLGAVGPLLLYADGRVQHLGIGMQLGGVVHLYGHFPAEHPVARRKRNGLQAITGAAMLLDSGLFQACGGFHTGYVNGFEDIELCLRIREQGKTLSCLPQSRITHLESQTPGRGAYEEANAELCSRRVGDKFRVDTHIFAAEDGYTIRLSEHLRTVMELAPGMRAALRPLLEHPGLKSYETLLAEPFWLEAYNPVCKWLEDQGAVAEAMRLRFLESRFHASVEGLYAWAKLATRAKNRPLAEYAGKMAAILANRQNNTQLLTRLAVTQLERLRKQKDKHDTQLEAMLTDWLEKKNIKI